MDKKDADSRPWTEKSVRHLTGDTTRVVVADADMSSGRDTRWPEGSAMNPCQPTDSRPGWHDDAPGDSKIVYGEVRPQELERR